MRKIIIPVILLVSAALIGTYFLRPHKEAQAPVRIGYLPIYVDLPLFVAQEKGFFRKHGVAVSLSRFASSPDIGTALVNNNIDGAASIAYATVLSSESRDPGKLKAFIVDSETPQNYLSSFVVLEASGIKSMLDLKGKKIASFPGPEATTFAKLVLRKYGLNPKTDVQFGELDAASHLSALESHTVDALFTYEPIATQAVLEKHAVKLLPGAVEREIINPWQAGVWVLTQHFITENPAMAKQVNLALYDAIDYIRQYPVEAKAALGPYTSIKPSIAQATPNIPFAKVSEVDLSAFQRHADILQEEGIISKHIDAKALLLPPNWANQ